VIDDRQASRHLAAGRPRILSRAAAASLSRGREPTGNAVQPAEAAQRRHLCRRCAASRALGRPSRGLTPTARRCRRCAALNHDAFVVASAVAGASFGSSSSTDFSSAASASSAAGFSLSSPVCRSRHGLFSL